jgi:5-methyltetrahydropteroyltriglutamate--homocysteine methyltransferase
MTPSARHEHRPDVSFDGGGLDCGSGLLLLIRKHIGPLSRGQLLEIRSTEISVDEDLPAWCRLTGNELISCTKTGKQRSFLVCKGRLVEREIGDRTPRIAQAAAAIAPVGREPPRAARPALPIAPLAVMGIGSWPRPRWMIEAMHAHVEGRLDAPAFHETANDAVRLAVAAQERVGADVVTDAEQRRDSYASFVASRLDNCQLIPLTDLLPLVDDPEEFKQELRALDVPASELRIRRSSATSGAAGLWSRTRSISHTP